MKNWLSELTQRIEFSEKCDRFKIHNWKKDNNEEEGYSGELAPNFLINAFYRNYIINIEIVQRKREISMGTSLSDGIYTVGPTYRERNKNRVPI